MTKSTTLKIDQCNEQVSGPVRKVIGLLAPKAFCHLLDVVDLSANPRSAKKGAVTRDIENSLRETPELFPAKTKGILLASSAYARLERQRYRLEFQDAETEGLLDGGHNALGIGRHILHEAGVSDSALRQIRDWESFRTCWTENRQQIAAFEDVLDFSVPIEIQVPASMDDSEIVDDFRTSLLDIGAARNNNVQLTEETKANKLGLYDELKESMPGALSERVEWKANEGGEIKVRDIVALAWIPLSMLELPDGIRVNPNQIYRNKAVCVEAFNRLLKHEDVSSTVPGKYEHKLKNESVRAALKISAMLPELYDEIYARFPEAYNKAGGSFGKISAIKIYDPEKSGKEKNPKYLRNQPQTPFYNHLVDYTCPDGFVVPLIYGMRALLSVDKDGILSWKVEPLGFVKKHFVTVMKSYRLAIELGSWDPQKVGKNIGTYEFAQSAISAVVSNTRK